MTTTYYVAFKPYAELIGVGADGSVVRQGSMALARRPLVYNCGGSFEADLSGIASCLTREVKRIGADVSKCLTSRTSTALFLLTSSGLVVYLLFRWQGGKDTAATAPGGSGLLAQLRSWLQWLFQEEEDGDVFRQQRGPTVPRCRAPSSGVKSPVQPHLYIAPCPNCLKGVCKIRKHHMQQRQQCLSVPSPALLVQNDSGSNASSPMKPLRGSQSHSPVSATPYNADDEHSDLEPEDEDESSLPYINLPAAAATASSMRLPSDCSAKGSHRRPRVPPEGLAHHDTPSPPPGPSNNLSCGDIDCKDPFCIKQRHLLREESTDSILTDSVTGSMADLVKGAREIRRLIRETSMDSVTSDLSLRLSCSDLEMINPTTCDDYMTEDSLPAVYHTVPHSKSEPVRPRVTVTPETSGLEGSSPDLRVLRRPQAPNAQKKMRKLWRISAPMSDAESPVHGGAGGRISTDDEASLAWESPNRGWHGVATPMTHPKNVSRSSSYMFSDTGSNLDCWEWDSEGFGGTGDKSINSTAEATDFYGGHETWLPSDSNELDLETELAMSSSRRDSFSSDVSIRHQVRLPPSGRSSVAKGHSPSVMTPSASMDKEMMNLSFGGGGVGGTLPPPPSAWDPGYILSKFQGLRRSSSGSSIGSAVSNKGGKKRTTASCSDESGVMVDSSLEGSFDSNPSNFSAVTTPLSPVKEVKEPRSQLNSPTTDEHVSILTTKKNSVRKNLADTIESQLPDLEVVSPMQ